MQRRDFLAAGLFGGVMIFSPQFGRFFRESPKVRTALYSYPPALGFSISQEMLEDDMYGIIDGSVLAKVTGFDPRTRMHTVEIENRAMSMIKTTFTMP